MKRATSESLCAERAVLQKKRRALDKRLDDIEDALLELRKRRITFTQLKTLVMDKDNWNSYDDEYEGTESEAYGVCDPYGGCLSSACAIPPSLLRFDALIDPSDVCPAEEFIMCALCRERPDGNNRLQSLFDDIEGEFEEGDTFLIDPEKLH